MEIRINLKHNKALVIEFGRKTCFFKSIYLISIIIEKYDDNMSVKYASFIKGFFRKRSK